MAEATAKLSARPVWDCKKHAVGQGAVEAGRSGFSAEWWKTGVFTRSWPKNNGVPAGGNDPFSLPSG